MHYDPKLPLFSSTFRVGKVTCRMRFDGRDLRCEWDPEMPRRLSRKHRAQYEAGRNALVEKVARAHGATPMIVVG